MKPPSLLLLPTDNEVPGADVYLGPFTLLSKKKKQPRLPSLLRETTVEAAASSSLKNSLQNFDRVLELLLYYVLHYTSSIQECRSSILERAFDIMLCPELLRSCAHILFLS